ncbi:hypothetical protein NE237_025042 [Protea cynaroides]|uniref:Uncharacterized protein n=1 Tax=Protea cynaroides TaxID=273540 RepID=A0A9Q0JZS2_9MAGN|nr:hypothetical protein NE237_025042 [Protea cynaroides]
MVDNPMASNLPNHQFERATRGLGNWANVTDEVDEQEREEGELEGHVENVSEELRQDRPVWDSASDGNGVAINVADGHSNLPTTSIIGTSPLTVTFSDKDRTVVIKNPSRVEVVFSDVVAVDNSLQNKGAFTTVGKRPPRRPPSSGKSQAD